MKRLLLITAALTVLAIAGFLLAPTPHPTAQMESVVPAIAVPQENLALRTSDDAVEVFRRAFWRDPTQEDQILHAERREWASEENGVRRWQWFLAVQPSAAFSTWLRESNPFHLAKVDRSALAVIRSSPTWFPATTDLARCEIQQTATGGMTVLFDPTTNTLYATDAGRGFAASRQAQVAAQPAPVLPADAKLPDWQPRR